MRFALFLRFFNANQQKFAIKYSQSKLVCSPINKLFLGAFDAQIQTQQPDYSAGFAVYNVNFLGEYVPILVATRGPKTGRCNICGDTGALTEDHTPPKGCIRVGQMVIRHVVDRLNAEQPNYKGRRSQNGLKYRTLCSRCNNTKLGANFDIEFNLFVNKVGTLLTSSIKLPSTMLVKAKPQKVMRAVLGHLAAQGVDRYDKGPDTMPLRNYFLDEKLPLPDSINIYYWIFPYKDQVLVRDCAYLDLRVGKPVVVWFTKFFLIAFLVTWGEPSGYAFDLPNLAQWRSCDIDEIVELPVHLNKGVHQYWLETSTDNYSVITYGKDAVFAEHI